MNRVLFGDAELSGEGLVRLQGRRAAHLLGVLRVTPGQTIRMGMLNGVTGSGTVCACAEDHVCLQWTPGPPPPPSMPLDLMLALPRPKVLKRLWAPLAALGVRHLVLVNAAAVERPYFDTHWLDPDVYTPLLIEGLEQSGDTRVPTVRVIRRLRPFVEDELDAWCPSAVRLLAHPDPVRRLPNLDGKQGALLAVGPEGGWTPFELELLESRHFQRFSLGWRTLRSDTACIALVSVLQAALPEAGHATDPDRMLSP